MKTRIRAALASAAVVAAVGAATFTGGTAAHATVSEPATSGAEETLDILSHDGYGAHEILMLRHQDVIIGVTCNFAGPGKPGTLGPLRAALAAHRL